MIVGHYESACIHDFDRIHFDSISTVYPTAPKVNIDTLTTMDTATDGKTYVLTDLDVKLPTRPERDTMRVKLDMGAEANILLVRTYNKMFLDRVLEDGTPDPKYLQPTHIEFECNKDSIIRSLGCISLNITAPGKKLMVNFMHNLIPHLSEHTAPLRGLLTKNAVFHWDKSTNADFQKLKSLIAEAQKRSLKFNNRNLPLTVQADASKHGLGAALLQQGESVAFASKSLSETEQRYANIERELLVVVFACEWFKTCVLGKDFMVGSDHKLLEMIALKNLVAAPPRLQSMLLRLQPFNCTTDWARKCFLQMPYLT